MQAPHFRRKPHPPAAAAEKPAPPRPAPPRSILLVKTSSLGDVIHNLPVASDLRRRYPEAQIDWLVEEGFIDIPRLHPAIRRTLPVALRRWRKTLLRPATWREIAALLDELQQEAYDLVLDTQGLLKSALLTQRTRLQPAGRRCGYAAEAAREPIAARFYTDTYAIPKNIHAVERNRWLAAAACEDVIDTPPDYGLSATRPILPNGLGLSLNPGQPYAVLLTATSRDDKLWPEDRWRPLIQQLIQQGLCCLLPAGSATERARAEHLATSLEVGAPQHLQVLPPQSIAELAGICAGARLVIGVDTGLTHLAAALGRPTLALFCASHPGLTGVYTGDPASTPVINLGTHGTLPDVATVLLASQELLSQGRQTS